MTGIGITRGPAGSDVILDGFDRTHPDPTNGRQGKSAASGRAQVVGWVGYFWHMNITPCCRFCHNSQSIQRSERRRPEQHGFGQP
jgi:hypothetical protein